MKLLTSICFRCSTIGALVTSFVSPGFSDDCIIRQTTWQPISQTTCQTFLAGPTSSCCQVTCIQETPIQPCCEQIAACQIVTSTETVPSDSKTITPTEAPPKPPKDTQPRTNDPFWRQEKPPTNPSSNTESPTSLRPSSHSAGKIGAKLQSSATLMRNWTDVTGQLHAIARLLRIDGETLHFERPDGSMAMVSLKRLSDADKRFVASNSIRRSGSTRLVTND